MPLGVGRNLRSWRRWRRNHVYSPRNPLSPRTYGPETSPDGSSSVSLLMRRSRRSRRKDDHPPSSPSRGFSRHLVVTADRRSVASRNRWSPVTSSGGRRRKWGGWRRTNFRGPLLRWKRGPPRRRTFGSVRLRSTHRGNDYGRLRKGGTRSGNHSSGPTLGVDPVRRGSKRRPVRFPNRDRRLDRRQHRPFVSFRRHHPRPRPWGSHPNHGFLSPGQQKNPSPHRFRCLPRSLSGPDFRNRNGGNRSTFLSPSRRPRGPAPVRENRCLRSVRDTKRSLFPPNDDRNWSDPRSRVRNSRKSGYRRTSGS